MLIKTITGYIRYMPTSFSHDDSIDRIKLAKLLIDSAFNWASTGMMPSSPSNSSFYSGTYWGEVCNKLDLLITEAKSQGLKDNYSLVANTTPSEVMHFVKIRAKSLGVPVHPAATQTSVTIHVLHQGEAYCKIIKGPPRTWPIGHEWVPKIDAAKANCSQCIAAATVAGYIKAWKMP